MFQLFAKKPAGQALTFKIKGMHCVSCSLSIDGELEDTPGVHNSNTNYAKAETKIVFDPQQVSVNTLKQIIEKLGYEVII